jgi:hypothetical protein
MLSTRCRTILSVEVEKVVHDISRHETHALLHERLAPLQVAGALLVQHVGGEARHEGVAAAWERRKALQFGSHCSSVGANDAMFVCFAVGSDGALAW